MRFGYRLLACIAGGLLAGQVLAQPATAPSTAPVRKVVVPPGFKIIEAESHRFIAEAADEAWIRAAMKSMKPTTQPTTMPGDVLTKIAATKADITKRIVAELALPDAAGVQKMFNERLEPKLRALETLNPPLVYLVTTSDRLKEVVKGGWSDPQFYYNRAVDDVYYQTAQVSFDQENGDALVPVLYEKDETPAKRTERLANAIHNTEGSLGDSVMRFAINQTFDHFLGFTATEVFEPLKLKHDQEWLTVGVSNLVALRYSTEISGMPFQAQVAALMAPNPNNPLGTFALDLSNPLNSSSIRQEAMPAYSDLFRSRSMRAIMKLIEKGGDGAIAKVLIALRKGVPADGAGLVQLIKTTTNVDLTEQMKSGS